MSYFNPNAKFEQAAVPQRHMPTMLGELLVPVEADEIGSVSSAALDNVERALCLLADVLTDKDKQLFLGCGEQYVRDAAREAQALRRAGAALRAILRVGDGV